MRNEEMGQFLVLNLSIDSNSIDCGQVLTWNDHLIEKFDPLNLPLLLAFFSFFLIIMILTLFKRSYGIILC